MAAPAFNLAALEGLGLSNYLAADSGSDSSDEEDLEQLGLVLQQIQAARASKERQVKLTAARSRAEAAEASFLAGYQAQLAGFRAELRRSHEAYAGACGDLEKLQKKQARKRKDLAGERARLLAELAALRKTITAIDGDFKAAVRASSDAFASRIASCANELSAMVATVDAADA